MATVKKSTTKIVAALTRSGGKARILRPFLDLTAIVACEKELGALIA